MTSPSIEKLRTDRQFYCPLKSIEVINKERIESLVKLNWHNAFRGARGSKMPLFGILFYQTFCFTGGQEFLLLSQLFTRNF